MSVKMTVLAVSTESQATQTLQTNLQEMVGILRKHSRGEKIDWDAVEQAEQLLASWNESTDIDRLCILAGRMAGICYMKDSFFSETCQNVEKARKRAISTANMGHHSVADHPTITVLFEGIPKIVAMLLNSVEMYTTSEKSARYTEMQPDTQLECDLYKKWNGHFVRMISETYPNGFIDEVSIGKLAQENARYMISVFTPTIMGYTASLRQFNYIIDWCEKLQAILNNDSENQTRLANAVGDLHDVIKEALYVESLRDNKDRSFGFVADGLRWNLGKTPEYFGETYTTRYAASWAQVAQAQRHRTLNYRVSLEQKSYYIPVILNNYPELGKEWREDMTSLLNAGVEPQGELVTVIEQGITNDFMLKAKERLCGRAMLEITIQTERTMKKMLRNISNMSAPTVEKLIATTAPNRVTGEPEVTTKCGMPNFRCKEPCRWGVSLGIKRDI